jgi:hypothetical protein
MRIDNSRGISIAAVFRAGHNRKDSKPQTEQLPPDKSLIPLKNIVTAESRCGREPRTLATFVAQLIAKEQDALHTRQRNRAEPAEAVKAYRRMLNLSGVPNRYKARPF